MSHSKSRKEITALRDAALEDLMAATDAELRQEAVEDGEDIGLVAEQSRSVMREAAASALRQRLMQAKERMQARVTARSRPVNRPPLERIKELIQGQFNTNQSLALAFRERKKLTDGDWQSIYDDLVKLGVLRSDEDEY